MCKNPAMTARHRIAVLAMPGVIAFDLGVPAQVFSAARDEAGRRYYEVRTCTPDGGPVPTAAGFAALPEYDLDLLGTADTVIVPGIHGHSPALHGTAEVHAALREAHGRGTRGMAIFTRPVLPAAADPL